MALNPKMEGKFIFDADDESPTFVLDALKNNVVFLHYRTDVCSACDDMEPTINELEGDHTDATFIHINLDHSTAIEEASYDIYDVKSKTQDKRTGVPMFIVITLNEDNGVIKPFYKAFYGIHAKDHLSESIDFAQQLFNEYKSEIKEKRRVLAELFVDQNCLHCPLSEEALMELYDEGEVYFVSMITDADGTSGLKAIEREEYYKTSYGGGGHPRVDFDGGYRERMGANEQIKDVYHQYIQECNRSLPNITINVDMEEAGDNSGINVSVQIHYLGEGTIQTSLRTYIVEKLSRWKNLDDDPIPFGFLDYAFDEDIILESNEWHNTSRQWNGTDALEYDVLNYNNLAVIAALFDVENNYTIQTDAYFPAAVKGVDVYCMEKQHNVLAGGNTSYEIVVKNTNLIPVIIDLEILKTKEWDTALSELNISLDINETKTIALLVDAPLNAAIDEVCNVTITGVIRGEEFKRDSITTTTTVKDDIIKPIIVDVYHTPEKPKMKDVITIHTKAGDNKEVSSVKLSYFVCTEELCYPPIEVEMEKNINDYSAEIGPFENDLTTLHYHIIAEDEAGNVNKTEVYEQEFQSQGEIPGFDLVTIMIALIVVIFLGKIKCRK